MSRQAAGRLFFAISTLCLISLPATAQHSIAFTGRVVSVHSGDAATVIGPDKIERSIRIAGIDAPENGQHFETEARQFLAGLIVDKTVTVVGSTSGQDGSLTAQVFAEGRDVGYSMVWAGFARYRKGNAKELSKKSRRRYEEAERFARFANENIWSESRPVARRKFKEPKAATQNTTNPRFR